MSYVCPDKIGESLCLSVVDEVYCIELTGKTNNFILFHFCCRSVLHIVQNLALLYISLPIRIATIVIYFVLQGP